MSNTRNADFTIADAVTLELVSRQLTQITDGLAILSDQVKRLIDNETARDLKVDNVVKRVGRLRNGGGSGRNQGHSAQVGTHGDHHRL